MSQRDSGYARKANECYETPEWVTEALLPHLEPGCTVWEPACGSGKMARVLTREHPVIATDTTRGMDFFDTLTTGWQAIVTNPPYDRAVEFIERSLDLTKLKD